MNLYCPICINRVGKKGYKTKCGHKYHTKCLLQWIMNNSTCPMCRAKLRDTDIRDDEEILDPVELQRIRDIFFLATEIIVLRR